GLEAAGGVAAAIAARGQGLAFGGAVVPIVPAAILFDLNNGGDKHWGSVPPYRDLGADALAAAAVSFSIGNAGAGYGARAGVLKGGLGSASWVAPDGLEVGALVAVNAFGSVVIPGTSSFWAAPLEQDREFGGRGLPTALPTFDLEPEIGRAHV